MAYPFLSDEWIEEARRIRVELRGRTRPVPHSVRMNLVVIEVPFGSGKLHARLDTSAGEIDVETGHLEDPDLSVTVDYETARAILVDGNPQAGMQAFMTGRVQVQGDMAKLMMLQTASPDPSAQDLATRLREITS